MTDTTINEISATPVRLLAAQKSPFDVNAEDPVPLPGRAVGEQARLRNPGVVY